MFPETFTKDIVDQLILFSFEGQEHALEELAISGCFVEDLWIVFTSGFPRRWRAEVGEPAWRVAYHPEDYGRFRLGP